LGIFNQKTTHRIYYFLFLALMAAIPVHNKLVPPIISLIGINWILELNFREKLRRIRSLAASKYLLSFGILYLLYMAGTLYSSQLYTRMGAFFNLEMKLSILVFPLLFTTIDFSSLKQDFRNKMLYAFVFGSLVSCILIFNKAVFKYFQSGSTDVFYYVQLSFPQHPSYLALFLTFAIAVLLVWVFRHLRGNALKRNLAIVLILVFQVFVVLISSKAGILSVFLTYALVIIYHLFPRGENRITNSLVVIGLIVTFLATLLLFPKSFSRFYAAESAVENEPDISSQDGSVARILVWQTAIEIIKKHPLTGVGTGDVEPELMKLYVQKNIQLAMDESLNAHNQYLQTFLALGIIGFLVLVAVFVIPGIFAFRNGQLLYLLFLVMFAFNLLVESMLERQAGVVFYGLINSYLFYYAYREIEGSRHKLP
jgi:O-antigen ligase